MMRKRRMLMNLEILKMSVVVTMTVLLTVQVDKKKTA
jgi:hypothetical protein